MRPSPPMRRMKWSKTMALVATKKPGGVKFAAPVVPETQVAAVPVKTIAPVVEPEVVQDAQRRADSVKKDEYDIFPIKDKKTGRVKRINFRKKTENEEAEILN
jgi:hypothetical protein